MSTDDGGSAFPTLTDDSTARVSDRLGMSLRDFFATHALVFLASPQSVTAVAQVADNRKVTVSTAIASYCYEVADAMLAERAKEGRTA